jgi:hypothetical protein
MKITDLKRVSQIKFKTIIEGTNGINATYTHWEDGIPQFLTSDSKWISTLRNLRKYLTN